MRPASPAPTATFERSVLDALPLTIYTVDLSGRITSTNRAWSQFAAANGGEPLVYEEDVRGTSIFDAIADSASREQIERAMALLRAGRVPVVSWEFPCSSPDEERIFLMHISPLHSVEPTPAGESDDGDDHAVTGYVFSTVDITAAHRSREALIDTGIALSRTIDLERVYRDVAQQVRRAVAGSAFCLAVADDDHSPLRVVHATGYDDEDASALEARLAPVWRDALTSARFPVSHAPRGVEVTAPIVGSGSVRAVMTVQSDDIASPQRLDEAARILATIAAQTAAAIERAHLVRRVEQKRRLEAIGEVSAGVAHELRNPLFGISSAAQLLRFRVQDDPVVEKNVGRILREVERLNRMVTALLEYGRPNPVRLVAGDPDAVWDEVIDAQRGRLESKSLLLQRERATAPANAARVRVDGEQLAQVFLNVLMNAIDAAPDATDLTLASTYLPNGSWRCRLQNAGAPIPSETLARAFEIFYSTKPGGTGIGLALCQRIVDEHGGTIALESDASGTVLTVTLPAS